VQINGIEPAERAVREPTPAPPSSTVRPVRSRSGDARCSRTTLIMPEIVEGPEGGVGCLQGPVVGLRATRTWIGRHGVHAASLSIGSILPPHPLICLPGNRHGGGCGTGWRRGRDSNPRYALRAYNGLANRRLQPLGHLSACKMVMAQKEIGSSSDGQPRQSSNRVPPPEWFIIAGWGGRGYKTPERNSGPPLLTRVLLSLD
jgi:hypothetical protein